MGATEAIVEIVSDIAPGLIVGAIIISVAIADVIVRWGREKYGTNKVAHKQHHQGE